MKLVVGVSRTPFDPRSLDVIAELAGSDAIRLLHVTDRRAPPQGPAASGALQTTLGTPALGQAHDALAARGLVVDTATVHGDVADALVNAARATDAELIVTRAHDRAPSLLRRVFGDNVTRLIERADRPVLALRAGREAEGRGVLLASDHPGVKMLDATALVARATASPVTVLHVEAQATNEDFFHDFFQRPDDAAAAPDGAPQHVRSLARAVDALRTRNVEAQARVRAGLVEEQLAREANDGDHWLLVVRGRSVGRIFRVLFGHSFTEDLVRHVRTSILIVK